VAGRRLFDAYLAVDWSARDSPSPRRPSRDAVWLAHQSARHGITATVYARTRQECFEKLRNILIGHVENGRRVFVGFDFPFGFPSGFASVLGLKPAGAPPAGGRPAGGRPAGGRPAGGRIATRHEPGQAGRASPAWRLIWEELSVLISDEPDNRNNRFDAAASLNRRCGDRPGPLWGCPGGAARPGLPAKSPRYPYAARQGSTLERLRWTEKRQPGTQSVWKLFGAGSVGSQCLVGIPYVLRLREDERLRAVSRIWPFETGFTEPGGSSAAPPAAPGEPFVMHAEIWPSLAPGRNAAAAIKDEDQVRAMVAWLRSLDDRGWMEELLRTPPGLPPRALHEVLSEEGWIAGTR
jgi:hypothetical protein